MREREEESSAVGGAFLMLATAIKICKHVNSHTRKLDEWMHPLEQDENLDHGQGERA